MEHPIKRLLRFPYFYLGISLILIGMILNNLSAYFIIHYYDTLPVLQDIILDNIPYIELSFLYDILSILSALVFILFIIFEKKIDSVSYYLVVFGIIQIIRALFIVMTPFGNPGVHNSPLNGFNKFEAGVFPSGHTGSAFLAFLFAEKWYKPLLFVILISIIGLLLLSRGHYTVDIFAGVIFATAIYLFSEKYLKEKLLLRE